MGYYRDDVVNLARSWIGKNEADGSYKSIIDIYNLFSGPLPRGIKMQYGWAWCACTWSAIAIKLGYTKIMPIEISCGYLIEKAKEMGIWVENDGYVPKIGDAILYDWDDNGIGDDVGWPDHIGIVEYVNKPSGYFIVIEGNYNDSVKKRTMSINGRYIRGFIAPKYDSNGGGPVADTVVKSNDTIAKEVIAGVWGSGEDRKKTLTTFGYDYNEIQKLVNQKLNGSAVTSNKSSDSTQPIKKRIKADCSAKEKSKTMAGTYKTTADLYCRNDAGTNKKALCLIPKGTKVQNYGYYNVSNGVKWPSIQVVLDGVEYTGFCCMTYLERA